MIVRNHFHSFLDELMALIFESLAVSIFTSVDTSTEVIVLWWRRWRSVCVNQNVQIYEFRIESLPVAISRDDIVDPKLLANLLDTQM